mmetsp:Transcript_7596/g.17014  ORF Transcript_7596/g.17014 Transcript_7596/m.17014 type:complete len:260 (-) Transcript_7596:349-1128(-)
MSVILNLVRSLDGVNHARNHVFRHIHQVIVICIRLIEFARGEFRVVRHVDALVAELATDFIHAFNTTDDKLLEIKFRRNTHEKCHVQVIMVRDERTSGSTARNHVHHRCFNLEEIAVIQILAHVANNVGADVERIAHLVVHDQIEETHTETRFNILQSRETRKHVQARSQDLHTRRENGKFTALGLTRHTLQANDITATRRGMNLSEIVIRGATFVRHDLNLLTIGNEIVKVQLFPAGALGHNPSGDGYRHALGIRRIR